MSVDLVQGLRWFSLLPPTSFLVEESRLALGVATLYCCSRHAQAATHASDLNVVFLEGVCLHQVYRFLDTRIETASQPVACVGCCLLWCTLSLVVYTAVHLSRVSWLFSWSVLDRYARYDRHFCHNTLLYSRYDRSFSDWLHTAIGTVETVQDVLIVSFF